jgi:hypothetical protein
MSYFRLIEALGKTLAKLIFVQLTFIVELKDIFNDNSY